MEMMTHSQERKWQARLVKAKDAGRCAQERLLNQQIGAKEAQLRHTHADKCQEDSKKYMNQVNEQRGGLKTG